MREKQMRALKGLGVGVVVFALLGLVVLVGIGGRDTASPQVHSYEDLQKKYASYLEQEARVKDAQEELKSLEAQGMTDRSHYDNVVLRKSAAQVLLRRIAADYNAMSGISYQKVWKDKGLPERLGE